MSHQLVELARQTLAETVIHHHRFTAPPNLVQEFPIPAPVFVTLRSANGELRGCIGSVAPTANSLAEEVVAESVATATRDPRFQPVAADEVPSLQIEVSVLSEPEPIDSLDELDPARYGVIVVRQRDGRRGLLLPDIEGIETPEMQVRIARRKAWIGEQEPVRLFRFSAEKFE